MGNKKQREKVTSTDALQHLKEATYPKKSGVYLMKDAMGTVLYVGKAKNLDSRIRQYFVKGGDGRMMIPLLMAQVAIIDTLVVSSEKEALLLENNLIKEHKPKYNALLKDDKSFFSLMINHKDQWPMVRLVRYKGRPPIGHLYFGPFTHSSSAKETLQLMRKLFPLRSCSDRELYSRTRPCVLYDMKRCIAPCVGKCTAEEYTLLTEQAIHFLRGHSSKVVATLEKERDRYASLLAFEKAESIHRTLLAIEKTLERQQVELLTFGDYDAFALFRNDPFFVLMQLKIREGKVIGKQEYLFEEGVQSEEELVSSFLLQRYQEEEEEKSEILLPFPLPSQDILSELIGRKITHPKKGKKEKLIKIAQLNAEEAAHRIAKEKDAAHDILMKLEEELSLNNYPLRIECYDNSHFSQSGYVSVRVTFTQGKAEKSGYRKYKIEATDDYGALKEVLTRRFREAKEETDLPDLILIDGGKGQLSIAEELLASLDIARIDLVALSKEEGRHDRGLAQEKIFISGKKEALLLSPRSKVLLFLQKVRDETHRFALTFQKLRRKKELLHSNLEKLPGFGKIKTKALLTHFGSMERIAQATPEEWRALPSLTEKDIDTLKKFFSMD